MSDKKQKLKLVIFCTEYNGNFGLDVAAGEWVRLPRIDDEGTVDGGALP